LILWSSMDGHWPLRIGVHLHFLILICPSLQFGDYVTHLISY
jgi:hypothetical protein